MEYKKVYHEFKIAPKTGDSEAKRFAITVYSPDDFYFPHLIKTLDGWDEDTNTEWKVDTDCETCHVIRRAINTLDSHKWL
jgi:hypothetical protein